MMEVFSSISKSDSVMQMFSVSRKGVDDRTATIPRNLISEANSKKHVVSDDGASPLGTVNTQ